MKPVVVLDCSITMTFCIKDEATAATTRFFENLWKFEVVVPTLWYVEVANVLWISERRGRLARDAVTACLRDIGDIEIFVDTASPARAFTDLLPLCRSYGLSAYDALYLDLAARRSAPLATLDKQLRAAAKACSVSVIDF